MTETKTDPRILRTRKLIREQLEVIFHNMLQKQKKTLDNEALNTIAAILSWGIYGASVEWKRNGMKTPPEQFIISAIPYLISGIE